MVDQQEEEGKKIYKYLQCIILCESVKVLEGKKGLGACCTSTIIYVWNRKYKTYIMRVGK